MIDDTGHYKNEAEVILVLKALIRWLNYRVLTSLTPTEAAVVMALGIPELGGDRKTLDCTGVYTLKVYEADQGDLECMESLTETVTASMPECRLVALIQLLALTLDTVIDTELQSIADADSRNKAQELNIS